MTDAVSATPIIEVTGLTHTYGRGATAYQAIGHVEFTLADGDALSIVGPSGAGKTTLLRCLAGLTTPTGGQVKIAGVTTRGIPQGISVVFQDYSRSLFPWLRVARNVTFPLRRSQMSRREMDARADEVLALVGLPGARKKYPWQLSGGMQQRVAIARALITSPRLLFMDEPFASVDAQTRSDLEDLVLRIREETGTSVVTVTHDIDESVYLSDVIIVLSGSPSRVIATERVHLPYPREQVGTKRMDEFLDVRQRVYELIHPSQRVVSDSTVNNHERKK